MKNNKKNPPSVSGIVVVSHLFSFVRSTLVYEDKHVSCSEENTKTDKGKGRETSEAEDGFGGKKHSNRKGR